MYLTILSCEKWNIYGQYKLTDRPYFVISCELNMKYIKDKKQKYYQYNVA